MAVSVIVLDEYDAGFLRDQLAGASQTRALLLFGFLGLKVAVDLGK